MESKRIALVTRGGLAERETADGATSRFANLYLALTAAGHRVDMAIYDEEFSSEVREQLLGVDVALVWVNPIDNGRDRAELDLMLSEVADAGVVVSTHPDVIETLGTKQVLYDVRELTLGSDIRMYRSGADLLTGLAASLPSSRRVLKRKQGSSGDGVWSVALENPAREGLVGDGPVSSDSVLRVRHAKRGAEDELVTFADFGAQMAEHFDAGPMFDQQHQARLSEGMVRCYLVRNQVAGFGYQDTNALVPAASGEPPPTPTTRNYFPETKAEFQQLKTKLETEWVPEMLSLFDLDLQELPLLWDCDFLLGQKDEDGDDTYVLCEINVSSVSPYPESAVGYIVDALRH